jgi:endonuclease YncB( thermonuclease family)
MRTLLFFAALLAANTTLAGYGAIRISDVTSIYDADTFRVDVDSWPPIIGHRVPVRIKGVDAPELRGSCDKEKLLAREAKRFTVDQLRNAEVVELRNLERGKYFRILADVYVDGVSLGASLINSNHARPYAGGTRLSWCE